METRNENLEQSKGDVYERLQKTVAEYERACDKLKEAVEKFFMIRLFLEETDWIHTYTRNESSEDNGNLLGWSRVSKGMETRNENLVQSSGDVYEKLQKTANELQKSLDELKKDVYRISMYLMVERLFLEEMERVYGVQSSIQASEEFLNNPFYKEKGSSD